MPPECPYPSRKQMKVERRDGETVEQLLRRFNKGVVAERITKTYREKMHFVSKSEQRKEKRRRAERNRLKKARQTQ
jgi:small subunit ribosomal protein S21